MCRRDKGRGKPSGLCALPDGFILSAKGLSFLALGRGTNDDRKVRKVNGSECTRGSQNAGRNASKIRELFQRRLANDWAKNGYFQYSVTRTVCEVFGTPRAVAIMGGHESGR
jgi:hypothetical protein